MADPSLEPVRRRFEREAAQFDAIYRLERNAFYRWFNLAFRKAIFERYDITFEQSGDVTDQTVLDIGCGSGIYSVDFARRGARRVVGIDFSANMLDLARQQSVAHGVEHRSEFIQADFLEWNSNESFDTTIAIGVFDYLSDPDTFLRKMVGTARRKVIASFPGHSRIRERLRRLRYRVSGKGSVYFYSHSDVERLARAVGLENYSIIPIHSSGTGFILVGRISA